jgi:MFS transporter, PPP family, 3-phenylpropionic acid transporter
VPIRAASRLSERARVQGLFVTFGFSIAAFFPFLALYYRDHHGLSESQIGLIFLVAGVARTLANPVWGHMADTRIGRLTALQIGLVGAAVAALWLNAVDGLFLVALATAAHSAFMVAHGANLDAIVLTHLGDDQHLYGRIRAWESLTYAVGALGFGAILQAYGVRWAMPCYAASLMLTLGWSTTIERDRGKKLAESGRLGSVGAVFKEAPRFWGFLAAVLLVWTGFNAAWFFISLRIEDAGGGPLLIGIGVALGGLVEVPTMRGSSRLQRRFGLRRVFVAACTLYALGFLLWGTIDDPTTLSLLTMLEGVAFSLLFTSSVVIVGRLVPAHLYATGAAISQVAGFGLGPILGGFTGGVAYEHLGALPTYLGASTLALLAAIVGWFVLRLPGLDERGGGQDGSTDVAALPPTEAPLP